MSAELADFLNDASLNEVDVHDLRGDLSMLEAKHELLRKDVDRLFALFAAEKTVPPFMRGETYFPNGDQIPSHGSAAENFLGKIWAFVQNDKAFPMKLSKNQTGTQIRAGDDVYGGKADHRLNNPVQANNFFWVEL